MRLTLRDIKISVCLFIDIWQSLQQRSPAKSFFLSHDKLEDEDDDDDNVEYVLQFIAFRLSLHTYSHNLLGFVVVLAFELEFLSVAKKKEPLTPSLVPPVHSQLLVTAELCMTYVCMILISIKFSFYVCIFRSALCKIDGWTVVGVRVNLCIILLFFCLRFYLWELFSCAFHSDIINFCSYALAPSLSALQRLVANVHVSSNG